MANPYFDKIAWLYPIIGFLRIKNKFYKNIKKFTNPDSIVLDVGGGTGIIAELLVNDIKEITILDPSKNMLKKIKSTPELKNIKAIVFSGHSEKILQDQVKSLGAESYLIKGDNLPKDLVEFIEKISQ